MNEDLLKRIPRIPHWRYVLWSGPEHPDFSEEMHMLQRYIEEEGIDVGIKALDDPKDHVLRAININKSEPPIRRVIENMMLERCKPGLIRDAVYHKFKENIDVTVIMAYKKFFFDHDVVNSYDMAKHYEKTGSRMPKAPPVPGSMKEQYVAFKNGVDVELDFEQAMYIMFAESFFRSQEMKEFGWEGDDKAMKLRKNALEIMKALKDGNMDVKLPDGFDYEVEYPEQTAVSFTDTEGYDPNEDPNDLKLPDE